MQKYQYGHQRVYFVRLNPILGGEAIYKIGITAYKDAMNRFDANRMYDDGPKWLDHYHVTVIRSVVVDNIADAKLIESSILALKEKDFFIEEQFSGITEVRKYSEKQVSFLVKLFGKLNSVRSNSKAIADTLDVKKKKEVAPTVAKVVEQTNSNTQRAHVTRFIGPPGTGKTTTLLKLVKKFYDDGGKPEDIAFLSFTKKAAKEATDRMLDPKSKLNISKEFYDGLDYFSTLHSFSFKATKELGSNMLMNDDDCEYVETALGYKIGGLFAHELYSNLDDPKKPIDGTPISDYSIQRNLGLSNAEILVEMETRTSISDKKAYNDVKFYVEYKENNNKYDFGDTIELFHTGGYKTCKNFKVVIVDEAQDLSPQQWHAVERLAYKCDAMYVAGDDDQAIFEFSGGRVEHFINLKCDVSKELMKSFRIPSKIHALSQNIVSGIKNRIEKTYLPKAEEGDIFSGDEDFYKQKGTKMVISIYKRPLNDYIANLVERGVHFSINGKSYVSDISATNVIALENIVEGHSVRLADAKANAATATGAGVLAANREVEKITRWQTAAINKWVYTKTLVERGITSDSEIEISLHNVHRIKGGEADHVLLLDAYAYPHTLDWETTLRLYYVATTRAKQSLSIMPISYPDRGTGTFF